MNTLHEPVERWLRAGRSAIDETRAQAHLKECASCSRALDEADRLRALFVLPEPIVSDKAANATRFQLEREARLSRDRHFVRVPLGSRLAFRMAVAAAIVLSLWAGSQWTRHHPHTVQHASVKPRPHIEPKHKVAQKVSITPPGSVALMPERTMPRPKLRRASRATTAKNEVRITAVEASPPVVSTPLVVSVAPKPAMATTEIDHAFAEAWQLYRQGRSDLASQAFDSLLQRKLASRRADVLFWSALAHQKSGQRATAKRRFAQLVHEYPLAWHSRDARAQLKHL